MADRTHGVGCGREHRLHDGLGRRGCCGHVMAERAHGVARRCEQRLNRSLDGRERGEDIVGFYHSHPDHPARWSATDLAEAHWLGCSYVITSVDHGRAKITNSFALLGDHELQKHFVDEQIEVSAARTGELAETKGRS